MEQTINIKLKLKFGSNFQKEVILSSLNLMFIAWIGHYAKSHKKNRIEFEMTEENNKPII